MKKTKASPWKSIQLGLAILVVMVTYAYGFEITNIDLGELQSERRQESLTRVLRTLAHPDILEYEQSTVIFNAPIYMPCPADGSSPDIPEPDTTQPYVVVTPACVEPGGTVLVEGFGFAPFVGGPLRFVPGSDPTNSVSLGRATLETDASGHFSVEMVLPDDRDSPDVQFIRATARENVGAPYFSRTAHETWDKIIETVFMALLATTVGTILAFPISFIAARNLMKPVRAPLASIALSLLGWPVGIWLGYQLVHWVGLQGAPFARNLVFAAGSVILVPVFLTFALRWALPQVELQVPSRELRLARLGVVILSLMVLFFGLFELAGLMSLLGARIIDSERVYSFMGTLLYQCGEILRLITPLLGALAGGGWVSSLFGRFGQRMAERLAAGLMKSINIVLAAAAGATVFVLIGLLVEWLYQLGRPELTLYWPAASGAGLGMIIALIARPKDSLPSGMVIYYVTRTILNALRSVEALVMAIVFVISVGIGPFAGILALGLHTIVSLGKLYSEQVESIMDGPLEAIQATGANRLQTIVYAVIPQIIPPFISYTMYRWDINVRMSTIIGFVGGGGIGFLLLQNINLLNYRAASTQMLAIAVVVAMMDYVSSVLRERTV